MSTKVSVFWENRRFQKAVGVRRDQIVDLVVELLSREDQEPQQVTLADGTVADIINTKIETPYITMAVTGSYEDAKRWSVLVQQADGQWKDVLLASNWKESLKPGRWQEVLKALVATYVKKKR